MVGSVLDHVGLLLARILSILDCQIERSRHRSINEEDVCVESCFIWVVEEFNNQVPTIHISRLGDKVVDAPFLINLGISQIVSLICERAGIIDR